MTFADLDAVLKRYGVLRDAHDSLRRRQDEVAEQLESKRQEFVQYNKDMYNIIQIDLMNSVVNLVYSMVSLVYSMVSSGTHHSTMVIKLTVSQKIFVLTNKIMGLVIVVVIACIGHVIVLVSQVG